MQRVAAAYLKPSNRTLGVFVPVAKIDRAEIPPAPDVAALSKIIKAKLLLWLAKHLTPRPQILMRAPREVSPGRLEAYASPEKDSRQYCCCRGGVALWR